MDIERFKTWNLTRQIVVREVKMVVSNMNFVVIPIVMIKASKLEGFHAVV